MYQIENTISNVQFNLKFASSVKLSETKHEN